MSHPSRSPAAPPPPGSPRRRPTSAWPTDDERFTDRTAAGQVLGTAVTDHVGPGTDQRILVLGVPRGGIVVATEIAMALDADLDVLVAVPISLPWRPGTTVGAVTGTGPAVFDHDALAVAGSTTTAAAAAVRHGRARACDRQRRYRGERPPATLAGRTVVIADDGLSPAIVTRAAVRAVRAAGPARIVFAAPVCAAEAADLLQAETDAVVHLHNPRVFPALGLWYHDAAPVTDQDVMRVLTQRWGAIATTPVG